MYKRQTVFVVGAGPIGLFTIAVAKAMGASFIYVSDISEYRRNLALQAGATKVLDPSQVDVVKEILNDTDGLGCGTVFDTSGNVGAIKQGFEALRKCGHMVMVGLPSKPLVLEAANDIIWKEATIHGIHGKEEFMSWEDVYKRQAVNNPITTAYCHFLFSTFFSMRSQNHNIEIGNTSPMESEYGIDTQGDIPIKMIYLSLIHIYSSHIKGH